MQAIDFINTTNEIGQETLVQSTFNPTFWGMMGFNLICIAIVQTIWPHYFKLLFSTALNNRYLLTNAREGLNLNRLPSLLMNLVYFNGVSAVIYNFTPQLPHWVMFIYTGALLVLFFIKLIVMNTMAFIRQQKEGIQEHQLNHIIFFQVGALILTPFLFFTHYLSNTYTSTVALALAGVVVLLIFIREIQSLVRAFQAKISIFYIILYLCTLELLPLVVGIRVVTLNLGVMN